MVTVPDPQFELLLAHLKEARGFDFTGYKRSSLGRRVNRRMSQVGVSGYGDYLDYLEVHPEEFTALFNTVLINVTSFFRDPDAWNYLGDEVLPQLLAAKEVNSPIRVWSAGCASGEEAYSLAMLFAEILGPDEFRDRVKVYATDVDEEQLAEARQATYPEESLSALSPERKERFFEHFAGRYVFRKDLRRTVIFGRNDLVQDSPISRVDLLLCRNTLMYFNAETQARILSRFHFALAGGGVLFLGKAEMLLSHSNLFLPIDLKRRIFRKVPQRLPAPVTFLPDPPDTPVHSELVGLGVNELSAARRRTEESTPATHRTEDANEELRSTNEGLETTNDELPSTVEERETTNEELQSTNEELGTMNEELQSTNDELQN